jgi:hypothetical protein
MIKALEEENDDLQQAKQAFQDENNYLKQMK